jgi:cardiolipin synthase A/B
VQLTQVMAIVVVGLAMFTAGHALMYKRHTRAVIAWVAFIILLPLVGAILYWMLAINRVSRKARRRRPRPAGHDGGARRPDEAVHPLRQGIARVGDHVSPFPLCGGNCIELLEDGDAAYPAMLAAIGSATRSIALATYIFDGDDTGKRFGQALADAVARGVEVRVLVDAHGRINFRGNMVRWLQDAGVPVAQFMPSWLTPTLGSFNLRNHRKLLVCDGLIAFTGGMNITSDNMLSERPSHPVRDLHFSVEGPLVSQLMHVFVDDWSYTCGEKLVGANWFPALQRTDGKTVARAIPDGPDEYFEALKLVIAGALAEARTSVAIVTPYFLPDQEIISSLNIAALRGVDVDILLPSENDSRAVKWASRALYWQVLERGCRIWHSPAPFDHSKLLLVDSEWCMIGSTNWDPRSLRLNFELNVECHDAELGVRLRRWFDARREAATEVTLAEMDGRSLPVRLRDGAARLLTPYL